MFLLALASSWSTAEDDEPVSAWAGTHEWAMRDPVKVDPMKGTTLEERVGGGAWNEDWQDRMADFRALAEDAVQENADVLGTLANAPQVGAAGAQAEITEAAEEKAKDNAWAAGKRSFIEIRRTSEVGAGADRKAKAAALEDLLGKLEALGTHDAEVNLRTDPLEQAPSQLTPGVVTTAGWTMRSATCESADQGAAAQGTLQECFAKCGEISGCKGFSYTPTTSTCTLLDSACDAGEALPVGDCDEALCNYDRLPRSTGPVDPGDRRILAPKAAGRCGAQPYLADLSAISGTFEQCKNLCLNDARCLKFEHQGSVDSVGDCNFAGVDSGVQSTEPHSAGADAGAWQCGFALSGSSAHTGLNGEWKLSAASESCDAACSADDKLCDTAQLGKLTTASAVVHAVEAAGATCAGFEPVLDDDDWVGPVAGNSVCSYSATPGNGMLDCAKSVFEKQRVCPCKSCQENTDCPEQQTCTDNKCHCPEGTTKQDNGACHTQGGSAGPEDEGVAGSLMRSDADCHILDNPLCDWTHLRDGS